MFSQEFSEKRKRKPRNTLRLYAGSFGRGHLVCPLKARPPSVWRHRYNFFATRVFQEPGTHATGRDLTTRIASIGCAHQINALKTSPRVRGFLHPFRPRLRYRDTAKQIKPSNASGQNCKCPKPAKWGQDAMHTGKIKRMCQSRRQHDTACLDHSPTISHSLPWLLQYIYIALNRGIVDLLANLTERCISPVVGSEKQSCVVVNERYVCSNKPRSFAAGVPSTTAATMC